MALMVVQVLVVPVLVLVLVLMTIRPGVGTTGFCAQIETVIVDDPARGGYDWVLCSNRDCNRRRSGTGWVRLGSVLKSIRPPYTIGPGKGTNGFFTKIDTVNLDDPARDGCDWAPYSNSYCKHRRSASPRWVRHGSVLESIL